MLPRKPDALAILVAVISSVAVLGAFIIDIFTSHRRDLEEGRQRLQHFSLMLAEHTARSFEAIDILLRDTASDLSGNHREWRRWEASRGWEYLAQRHSRSLPQLRDLILFDEGGNQLFISTYFPTPRMSVRDRPYFEAVASGAETATFGPYIGRNSKRYTYGIARRIQDARSGFAGVAFAGIEPAYFPDFCWGNRLSDDFEGILINAKGQVVASCRPTDLTRQASIIGTLAVDTLYGGRLKGLLADNGTTTADGLLVAISPVPGYSDLRVLTAIPEKTLLANWKSRALDFGVLAALVVAVLLSGQWLVRRQVRELSSVTAALEEHRRHLEERIESATAELAGQKAEAERANTAKSRFLAAASHDLRQPLHALSLFATDLQRQLRSGNTQDLQRLSEQISTSTGVLGELLDSLLDVSRLDVAGIKTYIRPFPLQTVFDRLAASYRRGAQSKKLTLHFRPTRLSVLSDITLIERLLANLVSNAIRYTPDGRRILVAARRQGQQVRVEVRDNGIGIAPEHQAAIFAEFYQVGNTAREQNKGLGLGLSIVDRLARALDVPVALRSKPGEGTTFSITLPLSMELPTEPEAVAQRLGASNLVLFVGKKPDIAIAAELAQGWGIRARHLATVDGYDPETEEAPAIAVVEAAAVQSLQGLLAPDCAMVVINEGSETTAPPAYNLGFPIRPAKLRALLEQLQKTGSKSMP
ncbi:MAG: ATP-binding region, ATPase-like:Histidine kinase N-terminal [Rhodocyclaceae bacterium]|nr:ATP-binding region, ATPase-like:Histidine kinase N-terminal [Rhodocyclaceae bacterium]